MNGQDLYNVETKTLKDRIKQWRIDYVDNINSIRGSLLDQRVVAEFVQGQINDTQVLIQWCEILTHKIEKLEAELAKEDNQKPPMTTLNTEELLELEN